MNTEPKVQLSISVIIPTYNRRDSLLSTLASLGEQSYPFDRFEVVVVDDGGNDNTDEVVQVAFPFKLSLYRQSNQGSAAARNHGAMQGSGDILVFIDDDITLSPDYLSAVAAKVRPGTLIMGLLQPYESPRPSHYSIIEARRTRREIASTIQDQDVPYTECTSNNLGIYRSDFVNTGMWRDVLGDGPTLWGDVEFGFRACERGCRFVRVANARLVHRDRHASDLTAATQRAYHVSRIVQSLFVLHPEIKQHLPMFYDKGYVSWHHDLPALILRKLTRQLVSSPPVMWALERAVPSLERSAPASKLLELLYRWIVSGYIYRGYRAGLRKLVQTPAIAAEKSTYPRGE